MTQSYTEPHLVASAEEVDPLEAIARRAAQQMIQAALEREVEEYLGRQRYAHTAAATEFRGYRNGTGRERALTGGFGTVTVSVPRVSDTPAEQEPQRPRRSSRPTRSVRARSPNCFPSCLLKAWRREILNRPCAS